MKPLTTFEALCLKNAAHFVAARDRTLRDRKRQHFPTLPETGDIAAQQGFEINRVSSSPKAMARCRDICVMAISARAPVTA